MPGRGVIDVLAPELAEHQGAREVFEEYGEAAAKLLAEVHRVAPHGEGAQLFSIAMTLMLTYLQGQVAGITGRADRGG